MGNKTYYILRGYKFLPNYSQIMIQTPMTGISPHPTLSPMEERVG
jgi:hypothetical protein